MNGTTTDENECVLISFCNQFSSPSESLCVMNLRNGSVNWVDLSFIPPEYRTDFVGITGLCHAEDQIVIATQGKRPVLAILDKFTSKVTAFTPLNKCVDLHSIVFHQGMIYVVSAGTNEIYRVSLCNQTLGAEELYWQYPGVKYDRDEIHLNGLTLNNGRLIASCFGPKTETDEWGSAGRVFYIDNGINISEGLRQPHSPIVKNGRLIFAESKFERVYLYAEKSSDNWITQKTFELDGYVRGLAFVGKHIVIGVSADRKVSRSKNTYIQETKQLRPSSLTRLTPDSGELFQIPEIPLLGREIYDILPIETQCFENSIQDAVLARINSMESIITSERMIISQLIFEKQSICQDMERLLKDSENSTSKRKRSVFKILQKLFSHGNS